MAVISADFGTGGRNLTPAGSSGIPSLADALRDVADDLGDIAGDATVSGAVGAALGAFTDPPSAAEMATLRTRVNEMRVLLLELQTMQNARAGVSLRTTKG